MGIPKCFLQVIYFLVAVVSFSSCTSGGGSDSATNEETNELHNISQKTTIKPNNDKSFVYNFYIDNSGSMVGFIPKKNPTEFQKCMANFMQNLFDPKKCSYNFYTFNSGIYFISAANSLSEVYAFTSDLLANNIRKGNKGSTNFNYNEIINAQNKDNITVLISDFEPSKKDASAALLPGEIRGLVKSKLTQFNFSTLFLKFHSTYEKTNKPYYALLMGDPKKINDILLYIQHNNYALNGYDAFFILSDPRKAITTKLNNSQETLYDIDYDHHGLDSLITLNTHSSDNNDFKISFRINMDSIPFLFSYLLDTNSYDVENYKVKATFRPNDKDGFTHDIILTTNKFTKQNINVNLKNQSSDQFALSKTGSDIPVLIDAFTSAYKEAFPKIVRTNPNEINYLTKTITIK